MRPFGTKIAALAELLLPRACVVCGHSLGAGGVRGGAPLCVDCASSLRPLAGERCEACGAELISERRRCMRCRDRSWAFDQALPLFAYEGVFRALLGAFKFHDRRSLAPFLADLVESGLVARWPTRAVVPVPPRPGKIRERGWDQVEEIARVLERRGRPVRRILERLPSAQQKRLGLVERSANARAAYRLRSGVRPPSSLVLLDDVVTTGATAEACALALREGGAEEIAVIALAAD